MDSPVQRRDRWRISPSWCGLGLRSVGLDRAATRLGCVTSSSFGDLSGWSLTEAGRRVIEDQLAHELDGIGSREDVAHVHDAFLPYNATVTGACSAAQLSASSGPTTTFEGS
jgi:hypothetical protein